ncbi:transglycosylase domain-containing protein [Streptomyces xiamenensis]
MGRKRPGGGLSTTQQMAKFLGVSVLSGAVLAGLALPAVGALGLAAKGTVQTFDEIPSELTRPPLSQSTMILDVEGNKIAEVYSRYRTVIEADEMGPYVRQALVAIEDARFYEHGAIDLKGVLRALNRNVTEGGVQEGASTLTQQYVKNVFVEAAGDDAEAVAEATAQSGAEGMGRKIREMKFAIQLEQELTKDEILTNYLNITYFGQQAYGVEAASQRYFSKPAADLELHEAALLAGLVQSPSAYDPVNSPDKALNRRNTVLEKMVESKDITRAEADEAKEMELGLNVSRPQNGCITAVHDAGFFCDYVRKEILNNPVFGETEEERSELWRIGGLRVRTTLDPTAQAAAAQAAKDGAYEDDAVTAAVVQIQPGTGHILSMAQSRPYGLDISANETTLNLNVSSSMGGTTYGFQPGSTFKPITAAVALEAGISPAETYTSDRKIMLPMNEFRDCENKPLGSATEPEWPVQNERADMKGTWDMSDALGQSVNTYFADLERRVGVCETVTLAGEMGVRGGNDAELPAHPSATLGGLETTPLMMANAYATFANRGTYCEPVAILSVTDSNGAEMDVPQGNCSQVMSEHTADTVNQMLKGVVEDGTGQTAGLTDRENAGKTGTSDNRKNVWFVGYTPELSTAVRVGGDAEMIPMENISIAGTTWEKAGGGSVAGPIWRQAMTGALAGVPGSSFNEVDVPRGDDKKDDDKEDRDRDRDRDRDNDDDTPDIDLGDWGNWDDFDWGDNRPGNGWGRDR